MTTPPTMFPIGISGELAATIADLESIRGDLDFARYMAGTTLHNMHQLEVQQSGTEQQFIDWGRTLYGLWSAALIAYRRAFASGKSHAVPAASRFKIQRLRDELLTPEQKETDKELREFIDQHVAHRVLDLEQVKVLVFLRPPPESPGVVGLGPVTAFAVLPERELVSALSEICEVLIHSIDGGKSQMLGDLQRAIESKDMGPLYAQWREDNPDYMEWLSENPDYGGQPGPE